ncbi:hypothetical protein L2747_17850 [Shewanella marinintestina]|uniref:hypothetical protein n=1 Tax=Shewanella marinintestina TaxID=190305 RepID=UPI00200CF9BD|nr:hypothetical protein [Shewanella marinintestina]MCL1147875.1 hypothetical protein [Shewanella marinintestina]
MITFIFGLVLPSRVYETCSFVAINRLQQGESSLEMKADYISFLLVATWKRVLRFSFMVINRLQRVLDRMSECREHMDVKERPHVQILLKLASG